jgi:ATP-binding protein involved in chromosome partitioning
MDMNKQDCLSSHGNQEQTKIPERMRRINNKIVVLSGKGGVGKSTVALNLATGLMNQGFQVGLLDIDIHGPSIPKMLGIEDMKINQGEEGMVPVQIGSMKVMSIGFMLQENTTPLIWRGPMKTGVIQQFLNDVDWGDLDYLVVDSPPGTGDEPLSVCQLIEKPTGAVIVTTPQEISLLDVRKSVTFCKQMGLPIIGVVENMSSFVCPHCQQTIDIFKKGGGEKMTKEMGIPFLGYIPIDADIVHSADQGISFIQKYAETNAAKSIASIIMNIKDQLSSKKEMCSVNS